MFERGEVPSKRTMNVGDDSILCSVQGGLRQTTLINKKKIKLKYALLCCKCFSSNVLRLLQISYLAHLIETESSISTLSAAVPGHFLADL